MQALPETQCQSRRGAWKKYPDLSLLQLSSLQWCLPWARPNQMSNGKEDGVIPGAQGKSKTAMEVNDNGEEPVSPGM